MFGFGFGADGEPKTYRGSTAEAIADDEDGVLTHAPSRKLSCQPWKHGESS